MIAAHPFLFSALLIVSWYGMYRAGVNDARKACRAAFDRHMYREAP